MANKGHNLTALKADIVKGLDEMKDAAEDRQNANDVSQEVRSRLERQGIPRKALALGEQMRALDEDVRNSILAALPIVLEAIGAPIDDQLALTIPPEKDD